MQQLTATLLPSSAINVMSNEEDQCFQLQELGHITHHCQNVCCFECDEYGHIVVDCPDKIPPSGTPACHQRQNSNTRHCTRSTSRHHHQDQYRHNRSRSQSQPHRYRSHSCHNPYRGHSRSHHRESRCHCRSTLQCCYPSAFCYHCDTSHQRSSSSRSSSTHSRDCSRSRLCTAYKPSKKTLSKSSSSSSRTAGKPLDRNHQRVMIDDPQTDYYSTDDTSSDCKDDEDHLN